jgi:hypothetical protein
MIGHLCVAMTASAVASQGAFGGRVLGQPFGLARAGFLGAVSCSSPGRYVLRVDYGQHMLVFLRCI